jgi:hypothetical protein
MFVCLAGEQGSHDADRFFEHLQSDGRWGPAPADDVLVERLTRADAEEEAAVEEQRRRRGRLRHDGGMDAQDRTGHPDADRDRLRRS